MPKHFLYVMDGDDKAPAGDGDTKSWFMFYKWKVEGEVFVPRRYPPLPIEPGDYVWFAFWGRVRGRLVPVVLGGAQIVRVEDENRQQEFWYVGDDVLELNEPIPLFGSEDWEISAEEAKELLAKVTRSRPPESASTDG